MRQLRLFILAGFLFVTALCTGICAPQGRIAGPSKIAGPSTFSGSSSLLTVSDNFNRANSGTLGANWSNASGSSLPLQVLSNRAASQGGFAVEVWTADSFTSNQFSKATFTSIADSRENVIARAQVATNDLYACGFYINLDASHYVLFKTVSGSTSQIGSTSSVVVAVNDLVELDAVGTTLTCKVNGSTIFTQTDSSLSGGSPGVQVNDSGTNGTFDDWSGGNL